jgi:hypothetical protein
MQSTLNNNAEMFVPEKDVTETTDDGRTIQIAVKDVPIPMAEAKKLGLVKDDAKEEKAAKTPAENKSKTPKENK